MGALILLKPVRLNGEIVQPGTMIRVADEQGLADKGFARHLTKREAQAILSEYVRYAEEVFNKPQRVSMPDASKEAGIHGSQEALPFSSPLPYRKTTNSKGGS